MIFLIRNILFLFFFLSSSLAFAAGSNFNETTQLPLAPNVFGNVGIGSASPGEKLDVQGTVRANNLTMSGQSPLGGYILTAVDSGGDMTWSSPGVIGGWTVSGINVYETSGGNVGIGTTILNQGALLVMNGNVGIGTWAPTSALSVVGGINTSGNNNNSYINSTGGNLGIGSTNPGATLDVEGNTRTSTLEATGGATIDSGGLTINGNGNIYLQAEDLIDYSGGGYNQNGNELVFGTVEIGGATDADNNNLQVDGNAVIGADYAAADTAPTNGLSVEGNVGIGTWAPDGPFQIGQTGVAGTMLDVQAGENSFFGMYDSGSGLYYGFSPELPSPAGTSTLGGYYAGLGVGGSTAGGGNPIFGVLNASQESNGIGNVAFTVYDNNEVVTFHNVLDDGNGNVGIGSPLPGYLLDVEASTGNAVYGNTSDSSGSGVFGNNTEYGAGVTGSSDNGNGVLALNVSDTNPALYAQNYGLNSSATIQSGSTAAGTLPTLVTVQYSTSTADLFQAQNFSGASLINITSTGNMGIGTIVPKSNLSVFGGESVGSYVSTTAPAGGLIVSGNVGIGTAIPSTTLEVNGNLLVDQQYIYPGGYFVLVDNNDNLSVPEELLDTNNSPGVNGNCLVSTGVATTWAPCTGNVGIGTGKPSAPLNSVQFNDANNFGGSSNFVFNGFNVGIGTSITKNVLDVAANVSIGTAYAGHQTAPSNGLIVQGNVGVGTWATYGAFQVNGLAHSFVVASSGNVGIGTILTAGGLAVMNGNVGIGTWAPGAPLEVNGQINQSGVGGTMGDLNTTLNGVYSWNGPGRFVRFNTNGLYNDFESEGDPLVIDFDGVNDVNFFGGSPTTGGVSIGGPDGATIPTGSRFIVYGSDNTSSNSAVNIVNSAGNSLFFVRDDGDVSIGTSAPAGYVDIQQPSYTSNELLLSDGVIGSPNAFPALGGAVYPALTVSVSETTGSRPLWFGYENGSNWDSYMTTGACGDFSQLCFDMGYGGTNNTVIVSHGNDIAIGGAAGLGGFFGDDGHVATVYFANTNATLFTNADVGIGFNAPPVNSLDVSGSESIGNYAGSYSAPNNGLIVSGNVGIGTWAPTGTLQIPGKLTVIAGTATGDFVEVGGNNVVEAFPTQLVFGDYQTSGTTRPEYVFNGTLDWMGLGQADSASDNDLRIGSNGSTYSSAWPAYGTYAFNLSIDGGLSIGTPVVAPTNGMVVIGNVGIGSSAPGNNLDVAGVVRTVGFTMSGQSPVSGYVLTASDSTGDATWSSAGGVSGWTQVGSNVYETNGGGNVGIGTTNPFGGRLIVSGGNVGIGSLAPGQLLDVQGKVRATGEIVNGNVGIGTSFVGGNGEAGLSVMTGNVGIGTWTPAGQLDVKGTVTAGDFTVVNGNVGVGSITPGQFLDVNGGRVRTVGIGTTVPEPLCMKADGTFGYFNTPTWQGVCH